MLLAYIWRTLAVAMLSSGIAIAAYADDAPVYEVDNYPPPFDAQSDTASIGGSAEPNQSAGEVTREPRSSFHEQPSTTSSPGLSRDQRLSRLEQQLKNIQHSEGASKIEALQKEVQLLRGQVEELTHQLQLAKTQQQAMYTDLDKRVRSQSLQNKPTLAANDNEPMTGMSDQPRETIAAAKKPAKAATPPTAAKVKTVAKPENNSELNVAEEQQIYQTAYDLIKSKKYNEAINALKKMLERYPTGQSAANAHYWLGELYGLLNKSDLSATEFAAVVQKYPDSPKVSDAELKLGLIYAGQFKWVDAKASFKKVINRYPGSASARVASEQLKQIKQAGH